MNVVTIQCEMTSDKVHQPYYATEGSSGLDIHANLNEDLTLEPGKIVLVDTGMRMNIPRGYEAQIRSRSGLCYKNGVFVLNAPGTIDSDYQGDIKVILCNLSNESFVVKHNMRIAQMVICKLPQVQLKVTGGGVFESRIEKKRGEGGFGSTGVI